MLALLVPAAASQFGEVEISLGMPAAVMDMMSMMEGLAEQVESRRPPPANPCLKDIEELQCSSASCLLANLPSLSPSCAMLLKGRQADPSPLPVPASISQLMGLPMGMMVEEFISSPGGFEVVESFPQGGIPAEFGALLGALPVKFAQFFGDVREQPPPTRLPEASEHPCRAEVERCIAEVGEGSSALRSCLNTHMDDPGFSSHCKCFLRQTDSTRSAPEAPEAPSMRVVAFTTADEFPPPPPHMRHALCMFFMPAFIVVFALFLRRCCLCLCSSKPQFAAVVPPEQATIKTVEPLLCVAVKEVPLKA